MKINNKMFPILHTRIKGIIHEGYLKFNVYSSVCYTFIPKGFICPKNLNNAMVKTRPPILDGKKKKKVELISALFFFFVIHIKKNYASMRSFTAFSDQDQEAVCKILQSTVKFKMSHIDAKLLIFPADLQLSMLCFTPVHQRNETFTIERNSYNMK